MTADEIAAADLVFLATDIEVDMARFDGKPVYRTSTGGCPEETRAELDKAWTEAKVYRHSRRGCGQERGKGGPLQAPADRCLLHAAHGGSGGLIIALSFIFGIEAFKEEGRWPRP